MIQTIGFIARLNLLETLPTAAAQKVSPDLVTRNEKLWGLAQSLESSFLSEMLASAGVGNMPGEFGGGIGEQQFVSFLNQVHADAMVAQGGIGLAESIYRSLAAQGDQDVSGR